LSKNPEKFRNFDKKRKIDPAHPRPEHIDEAAAIIKMGGVVSFPTRCLYGLGADALNPKAVGRIFEIKRRPDDKPLLVLVNNQKDLAGLVRSIPPMALRVMENFWPGRITIVFEAKDTLPVNLTAGTGRIGIRLTEHPVAKAIVKMVGGPITGTSANLSGKIGGFQSPDLNSILADQLDLILDAGPLKGGSGSTVVDVTGEFPRILREGEISSEEIFAVLNR
jgi:L-threonylcarbamoyladenylate synthase